MSVHSEDDGGDGDDAQSVVGRVVTRSINMEKVLLRANVEK